MTTCRYTEVQPEQKMIAATPWKVIEQVAGSQEGPVELLERSSVLQYTGGVLVGPQLDVGNWLQAAIPALS